MDTVPPFFEAAFAYGESPQETAWHDESTEDFYVFTSAFGTLRLRKRQSYPTTFAASNNGVLCFGYGNPEYGRMIASGDLRTLGEDSFGSEEFLYGEADCSGQSVTIQRDTACVLPIFAARSGRVLALSNHSERLYDIVGPKNARLNRLAALNYMLFDDRYRPLLDSSEPLHDRVRLDWRSGSYATSYPADGLIASLKNEPESSARHFKQALEATLDGYWQRYDNIAFQLSGGLDSAIAPGYYADQGYSVLTGTLGLPGAMGDRQRAKLFDMKQRFGLENYIVDLDPSSHFPFAAASAAGQWSVPSEFSDLHLVATRQLADYLAGSGVATIFTGVGGDELCQNVDPKSVLPLGPAVQKERLHARLPEYVTDDFAALYKSTQQKAPQHYDRPVPSIAYSVMLTHLGFNNTFIDRNIWPVAPLADPKLFLFAQSIPAWHRHDKNLLRIYQFARSYPESIAHNETAEDFSEFIHLCKPVLRRLFDAGFASSHLAAHGLVDRTRLQRYVHSVVEAPFDASDTRILEVMRLLALELHLQLVPGLEVAK